MLLNKELKMLFEKLDYLETGYVKFHYIYKGLVAQYGYKCPARDVKICVNETDLPKDFEMDFHRFLAYMETKIPEIHCIALMRRTLEGYDSEKNGMLDKDDFEVAVKIIQKVVESSDTLQDEKALDAVKNISTKDPKVSIENFLTDFWKKYLEK